MPYGQVDKLTNLVPQNPANPVTLDQAIEGEPRLREAARILGNEMDGLITDGAGHALTEADLNAIANDLENLYDALDQCELSAGSPQARRLFS
jgi:DNA polymerase III alpha subunit